MAKLNEAVRRNDEDHAVLESLSLLYLSDWKSRVTSQDLVQVTGPAGVEVLRYDDRRREVGGQARHHARERFDAARR